jgi:hypothetical protein
LEQNEITQVRAGGGTIPGGPDLGEPDYLGELVLSNKGIPSVIPKVVYHYTSMDALLGIIDGYIWATNILYLNDVSEYEHFLRLVRNRLPQLANSPRFHHRGLVARLIARRKVLVPAYMDLPFVASFSQQRDSLAHWRSYCSRGNGVCIGFKSASLNGAYLEKAEKNLCLARLWPVMYLGTDNVKALDAMINQVLSESISLLGRMESAQGAVATDNDRVGLIRANLEIQAGRTKHKSFMHEREYRLVASLFAQNELVSFRASRSALVPYLKMRLPGPHQSRSSSPPAQASSVHFIDSVTIGPTPHPMLSADAVLGLLRSKGFSASVEKSSIPFRDW